MPVVRTEQEMPSVDTLINEVIQKTGGQIGMILTHVGVVRASSRNGTPVRGVRIRVNEDKLNEILAQARAQEGISAVKAFVREGELKVGDQIMLLLVAGDFRENVLRVLGETLDQIKAQVTTKEEIPEG